MLAVPALLETQRRFLAALYNDAAAGPTAAIAGDGIERQARLRIYRRSCNAIQSGALRTTYPAVLALVGEAFFDQTASGYRHAHPSRCGNLQAFGEHFADYLAALPAVDTLAYLPDVARLEWLRQQAALAAEADPPMPNESACAAPPAAGRSPAALHPSTRLIASPHPVLTIWRFAMQPSPGRLHLPETDERVMLWREDGQVAMTRLKPASFACIEALAHGSTLDAANAAGCAQDLSFDTCACIQSLVDHGLLVEHTMFDSRKELQSCQSSGV